MAESRSSQCTTRGVMVSVCSSSIRSTAQGRWLFSYAVNLRNNGERPVQLLSRYWHISDIDGRIQEVEGEGVVGKLPLLLPGGEHEYSISCELSAPRGTMRGHYVFRVIPEADGEASDPRDLRRLMVQEKDTEVGAHGTGAAELGPSSPPQALPGPHAVPAGPGRPSVFFNAEVAPFALCSDPEQT